MSKMPPEKASEEANEYNKRDILKYPHRHIPDNEWNMCTMSEAQERTSCNELSIFECVSHSDGRIIRKPDPFRCVKKYRRSAAGGGSSRNDLHKRTLNEIETSVWYLLGGVFTRQRPPNRHHHSELYHNHAHNLCSTVNFVDDRIRAVQVDLTTLLGNELHNVHTYGRIRRLQAMIIRYHLLSQYLLSGKTTQDQKKNLDYEWTFALAALRTSLSSYLDTWRYPGCSDEHLDKEIQEQDEILSYVALLHIAAVTRCRESAVELIPQSSDRPCGILVDEGNGMHALLSFFRKYVSEPENVEEKYPKFWWALKLATSIEEGNFILVLRMLTQDDEVEDYQEPPTSFYHPGMEEAIHSNLRLPLSPVTRWKIMARCCMAQVLHFLYLSSLRQYNKAFMKEEKVSIDNVGKLLCCPRTSTLTTFCKALGLPISTVNESEFFISMKTAAISFQSPDAFEYMKTPCRTSFLDPFVFGAMTNTWLPPKSQPCHDSYDLKNEIPKIADKILNLSLNTVDWGNFEARIDECRIHIPPSPVLWELVRC